MGVQLVFFVHISAAPDSTNNIMALAFGVLIVVLLIGGSLWIMANLNQSIAGATMHAALMSSETPAPPPVKGCWGCSLHV